MMNTFKRKQQALTFFFTVCISSALWGQQPVPAKFHTELGSGIGWGFRNSEATELSIRDLSVSFGYDLSDRFSLKLPLTLTWGSFNTNYSDWDAENKSLNATYGDWNYSNASIGLGAGYNFIVKPNYRLQLAAEAGNSLSGDVWKYFYSDLGCRFYMGAPNNRANGFIGLGVRQLIGESGISTNYTMPYLSFGFRLNSFKRK